MQESIIHGKIWSHHIPKHTNERNCSKITSKMSQSTTVREHALVSYFSFYQHLTLLFYSAGQSTIRAMMRVIEPNTISQEAALESKL